MGMGWLIGGGIVAVAVIGFLVWFLSEETEPLPVVPVRKPVERIEDPVARRLNFLRMRQQEIIHELPVAPSLLSSYKSWERAIWDNLHDEALLQRLALDPTIEISEAKLRAAEEEWAS